MARELTPAMEDYLELIIKLKQANKVVRVRDIAEGMKVTMPSVTSMLNSLVKQNLINHERYEYVDLTPCGLKKAHEALHKHLILYNFLKNILKLDPKQADIDACRMEHTVSSATFKKLVEFIEFIESCPQGNAGFWEYFKTHCRKGGSAEKCAKHFQESIEKFHSGKKIK